MIPLRRSLFIAAVVCAGCGSSESSNQTLTMAPPQGTDISTRKEIAYVKDGGQDQSYDLYAPMDSPVVAPPLLVFIHGGAWQSGDEALHADLGKAFAGKGVVTAVVNYRLSNKVQHPVPIEDVAKAIAHLAKNAQGYDPKRIFVMGHSAGAHMCGMLAAQPEFLRKVGLAEEFMPRGFIGLEGIYDIPNLVKTYPSYRTDFIEKAFGEDLLWPAASPTRLPIRLKAKWLLVHSTKDELVDMAQTTDFRAQLFINNIPIDRDKVNIDLIDPGKLMHFEVVQAFNNPDSELFKQVIKFLALG